MISADLEYVYLYLIRVSGKIFKRQFAWELDIERAKLRIFDSLTGCLSVCPSFVACVHAHFTLVNPSYLRSGLVADRTNTAMEVEHVDI